MYPGGNIDEAPDVPAIAVGAAAPDDVEAASRSSGGKFMTLEVEFLYKRCRVNDRSVKI